MTVQIEQLLKPRFKIIADYPGNVREIGSISTEIHTAEYFRKFPSNFRELQWWEEREVSEMPEYVIMNHQSKKVMKVFKHFVLATHGCGFINEQKKTKSYVNYLPATPADYENYLKQKTK